MGVGAIVLAVWVPLQSEGVTERLRRSIAVGLVVRATWLTVAVAGLISLLRDIDEIA